MYIVKIRDWAQISEIRLNFLKQQSDSHMKKYGAS